MYGIVLAAGGGTRLRPLTDALPKTLLPVAGETTIFELAVANLAEVGVHDVVVVVGHAADAMRDNAGRMTAINKALDPPTCDGEYIGVTLIEAEAGARLAEALQVTYERDTTLYYEDGYQQYADWGETIRTVPIGVTNWVEVDNHDDLARARDILCRS